MPELPDVEYIRTYLQHTVLQKTITDISVSVREILAGISTQQLRKRIKGFSIQKAVRHGKYCFLTIDEKRTLVLHFGMTGDVRYFKVRQSRPEHICLAISFDNDYTLAYTSIRKLGEIALCKGADSFISDRDLGPDALAPEFDERQFVKLLSGRRGMLKSALMNQQNIAGIGNVYSDEILFQEGLHPKTAIRYLDDKRLGNVFTTMREILDKAVAAQGKPGKMPDSYLTAHRESDKKCPGCQNKIEKISVAGRSACYCPTCQKKQE